MSELYIRKIPIRLVGGDWDGKHCKLPEQTFTSGQLNILAPTSIDDDVNCDAKVLVYKQSKTDKAIWEYSDEWNYKYDLP